MCHRSLPLVRSRSGQAHGTAILKGVSAQIRNLEFRDAKSLPQDATVSGGDRM